MKRTADRERRRRRVHEMYGILPVEVSLVDKPANRRPFLILKNEGGGATPMTEDELREKLGEFGIDYDVVSKADPDALKEFLDNLDVEKAEEYGEAGGGLSAAMIRKLKEAIAVLAQLVGYKAKAAMAEPVQAEPPQETEAAMVLEEARKSQQAAEAAKVAVQQELAAIEVQKRDTEASHQVERLLADRYITPVSAERLKPVLAALAPIKIVHKSDKGEEEVSVAEELVEVIKQHGQIDEKYFTPISVSDEMSGELLDEYVKRIKAQVR